MKINAAGWKLLGPLVTALLVLLLLNIGLYSILLPPRTSPIRDRARSFHLDFNKPYSGTGWYPPENDGQHTFAWTSSVDATLSFVISLRDNLAINLSILSGQPNLIAGIQLSANQTTIPLQRNGNQFSGVIPKAVLLDHPASLDLDFHTTSVFRPSDAAPGNQDTRTLGVAFDWLTLTPIPDNNTLYEFDQDCASAQGWSNPEIDPSDDTTFCWTIARDATKTVHIPRSKAFTLEVGLIGSVTTQVRDSFRLEINDTTLQPDLDEEGNRYIYTVDVPPIDADTAVVTFHVDQLVSPASLGSSSDQRTLGVQVDWLRITEKVSS